MDTGVLRDFQEQERGKLLIAIVIQLRVCPPRSQPEANRTGLPGGGRTPDSVQGERTKTSEILDQIHFEIDRFAPLLATPLLETWTALPGTVLQIARELFPSMHREYNYIPHRNPLTLARKYLRHILSPKYHTSPHRDAPAFAGLLAGSKAPDLDRRLARTPTQDRAYLASKDNLPHGFARRGDIAEVRARADVEEAHATVIPASDEELLIELQRCDRRVVRCDSRVHA